MSDNIKHPSHYNQGQYEAIDVIEDWTKDLNSVEAFNIGQVLKYLCRWKHKNGVEDLKKAKWYLDRIISFVEDQEKELEYIRNHKTVPLHMWSKVAHCICGDEEYEEENDEESEC